MGGAIMTEFTTPAGVRVPKALFESCEFDAVCSYHLLNSIAVFSRPFLSDLRSVASIA